MEQSVILAEQSQTKELGLKPTLVKDVVLISPGIWTGIDGQATNYSAETILHGFQNTDWTNMNLFLDHKDSQGPAVGNWAGFIRNARMLGNDLVGDVEVWHPMIAMFIKEAKAKFAVSMTTLGVERILASGLCDYQIDKFESFSMVHDPGCKISWLPKSLASGKETKTIIFSAKEVDSKKELAEHTHVIKSKKEVKKMEEEKDQKEAVEEKEDKKEAVEDKKELAEAKESETVKVLGAKVDAISSGLKELTSMVKELAANKEVKTKELVEGDAEDKEAKDKEAKADKSKADKSKEDDSKKELAETKEELETTKKELAAAKEDNSPDRKSLAIGGSASGVDDVNSVNMGMLGFLKENANL